MSYNKILITLECDSPTDLYFVNISEMPSIQKPQISIPTLTILIFSVICFVNSYVIYCKTFLQFKKIHISYASNPFCLLMP